MIEYHRTPYLLVVDRPSDVSRNDFIRSALVLGSADVVRHPHALRRSAAGRL
jgi:hypothetical protein